MSDVIHEIQSAEDKNTLCGEVLSGTTTISQVGFWEKDLNPLRARYRLTVADAEPDCLYCALTKKLILIRLVLTNIPEEAQSSVKGSLAFLNDTLFSQLMEEAKQLHYDRDLRGPRGPTGARGSTGRRTK